MVLCLGKFFASTVDCEREWKECIDGKLKSLVPLYILGPVSPDEEPFYKSVSIEDGGEMCTNVTYLGKPLIQLTCYTTLCNC